MMLPFRSQTRLGIVRLLCCLALFSSSLNRARAQDSSEEERIKYRVALASATGGGVYTYVRGKWGQLHLRLINPHEHAITLLCTTAFEDEKTLQYGRRVWLPPRSRMEISHPILVPPHANATSNTIDFRTSVQELGPEANQGLIRDDAGKRQLTGTLRLSLHRAVTGIVPPRGEENLVRITEVHNLVGACRSAEQLPIATSQLSDQILPAGQEELDALDQLIIADDRVLNDATALSAIRKWVYAGGRVWVFLDQVDPGVLEMLLGDEAACEVVDRVTLTNVRIHDHSPILMTEDWTGEFEQPVELVRTVVSNFDVALSVDGWPAAFWKKYGDGKVLVTTLGSRALLRPRNARDPKASIEGMVLSSFVPIEPLRSVSSEFFAPRLQRLLGSDVLEPIVQEYIGYEIPARWMVVGLLGGFGISLAGCAVVLWRLGKLELLGWIGPVLSVLVSAALIVVGQQHLHRVPPTFATMQVVEPLPGVNDIRIRGTAGEFDPDGDSEKLAGTQGGWCFPSMEGVSGQIRRLVWTDLDHWEWEELPQTAGLRKLEFLQGQRAEETIAARGTFGPDGILGQLQLPEGMEPHDAILATPTGRIGVTLQGAGVFQAPAADVFSREQYLSAGLLSDQQLRRSHVLQALLTQGERIDYPTQPTLLFWTDPWDLGLRLPAEARKLGSALVALPIQFQRPVEGGEVTIPAPFLPYRGITGPDGLPPSSLYNYRDRTWQEITGESTTWLRFQAPSSLSPLEPVSAKVRVQVAGPVGRLEILGHQNGQIRSIKSFRSPVGTLECEITDADLLKLDDRDGLLLQVKAGIPRPVEDVERPYDESRAIYWQIEWLDLELRARVPALPSTAP